ncbi:MAG: hypothetical protein CMH22_01565 [Methylophaga sp.]|uniref:DUF5677 domain-containing protein n=1 Tax=Methylophaga sp. UBA678 TaxID=1946901 RepID=UPI000C5C5E5B|nr:DUF5677 domain-containing protein [Methylophaga sp. UBA678]MAX50651.1 hypothetical protein [Methylophaga sp.]|tara:strand:+ start:1775 stop:2587 length:813 start_codon:yes stop_codon:yes gene_type:complete
MSEIQKRLWDFIRDFSENVSLGFEERWAKVKPDLYDKHKHEAVGGLLARQATMAIEMARSPMMWNGNVAPLLLRTMTDGYITLSWILDDIDDRSKKYIDYGLGQEKLFIEHLEESVREDTDGDDVDRVKAMIEFRKSWLESQIAEWATIVNIGSWSGMSTREMAKSIGRESIYKFAYAPFSGPAHNMWQHVGLYHMEPCTNPLHKGHLVPFVRPAPHDPEYLYLASKYVSQSFEVFDEKLDISVERELPIDFFVNHGFWEYEDGEENDRS